MSETRPTRPVDQIASDVRRRAYEAVAGLYEEAEHNDQIVGNGHHMAQYMADYAVALLLERHRKRQEQIS